MKQNRNIRLAAIGTAVALSVSVGLPAHADNGTDTSALREAVTATGITEHLLALQAIADANGGTRASGTPGYEASAVYVENRLTAAGYTPTRQHYSYEQFVMNAESFEQLTPDPLIYASGTDFATMSYSGAGSVTAPVQAVDINLVGDRASTSGCEAADFAGFTPGNVALIQRGTCTFQVKAENAIAAGAAGVVIFNQGNADDRLGLLNGTLEAPQASVPVIGTTFDIG
ncbi:MAG TPA: PA domain-containing protein, partial [Cryobacterium sp.]|nr:PA domain-containing protein [Cryobacterium sp.]